MKDIFKAVKDNDLIEGKFYKDDDRENATVLKFVKRKRSHLYFMYESGPENYYTEETGLIRFWDYKDNNIKRFIPIENEQ